MSNRLLNAVVSKNAAALESILQQTPALPLVHYRHANPELGTSWVNSVPDSAAWTRTIVSNWKEGAVLLCQYLPASNDIEKILLSIRCGASEVLAVLWDDLNGHNALNYSWELEQRILKSVLAGMGQVYNQQFETREMIPVMDVLVERGVNLSGVVPGDFEFQDFRVEGHSIWTRGWTARKFEYVDTFWSAIQMWRNWPRVNECIFTALSYAVNDQRSLDEPKLGAHYKSRLLRFLADVGNDWIEQISQEPAPNLFKMLTASGGELIKKPTAIIGAKDHYLFSIDRGNTGETPTILENLCSPLGQSESAWIRLPLLLNSQERAIVWPIWDRMQQIDPHGTLLNTICDYPSSTSASVLALMAQEYPVFFEKFWDKADSSGLTPADKWAAFGGGQWFGGVGA